MSLRRTTMVAVVVLYVFLWILAVNGARNLVPVLVVPGILVLMVWAGLALNRYLGLAPRRSHFRDPDDDTPR